MRKKILAIALTLAVGFTFCFGATASAASKINIEKCKVKISQYEYTYDGTSHKPSVTVRYKNKALKKGRDYTVKYYNSTVSDYYRPSIILVKGKGKYCGSYYDEYFIFPESIDEDCVDASFDKKTGEVTIWGTIPASINSITIATDGKEMTRTVEGTEFKETYRPASNDGGYIDICVYGSVTKNGRTYSSKNSADTECSGPSMEFSKEYPMGAYCSDDILNWYPVECDGYKIYKSNSYDGEYKVVKTIKVPQKTYYWLKDTKAYYRITAYKMVETTDGENVGVEIVESCPSEIVSNHK